MITKVVPGQLVASQDAAQVARDAATRIARALRGAVAADGHATFALSGGNTPRDAYALLAREPGLDWSKIDVLWVDERAVPPTDDRSNYRWAREALLEPARIPAGRVHRMPADAADLAGAARGYDALLRERVSARSEGAPSLDVMVLGIGEDGHTASLFPGEPTVDVTDRFVVEVAAGAGREARLTLTAPVIAAARSVFVLAVGPAKRGPLERVWAVQGDVHETPARVVRGCRGSLTWLIDRTAGGLT